MNDKKIETHEDTSLSVLVEAIVSDANWFPWWKKPLLMSDWESIECQALFSARMVTNTYHNAKETGMPFCFVEMVARRRYQSCRRYFRIRWRIENMKSKGALNLLHAIFVSR